MPSNIVVPEVGESIVDARVAKWLRKEGDVVSAGDPLVELETDKIDLEVGAPQAGVLSRIERKEGEDVKVGEVLGVIDESAASGASAASPAPSGSEQAGGEAAAEARSAKSRATPTAKKAAEQNDVDISKVQGSGDAGRVMKRDVERAAGRAGAVTGTAATAAAPTPQGRSQARRRAAEGASCRSRRRGAAAPRRRPHRRARAHVEAPRDHRQAPRRGAAAPRRCCRRSTKST